MHIVHISQMKSQTFARALKSWESCAAKKGISLSRAEWSEVMTHAESVTAKVEAMKKPEAGKLLQLYLILKGHYLSVCINVASTLRIRLLLAAEGDAVL